VTNEQFSEYAALLLKSDPGIRSVGLSEGTVIRTVFPLEGNAAAIGVDLLDVPGQSDAIQAMIQTGQPILAGPLDLIQNGQAFVFRVPVMLPVSQEAGDIEDSAIQQDSASTRLEYWGNVALVVDLDSMIAEFENYSSPDLQISLKQLNEDGSEGSTLFGKQLPSEENCVEHPIQLLGLNWRLGLLPEQGWSARLPDHYFRVLAAMVLTAFGGFIGWLFLKYHLLRSHHLEQLTMAQRSMQRAQARLQLAMIRGNIGLFDLQTCTGVTVYSSTYRAMLRDSKPGDWSNTLDDWESRLHPEDKVEARGALQEVLDGKEIHYCSEYRLRCGDGLYRWFRTEATGSGERGTEDHRIMGVLIDVSADRESRERLQDERLETQLILDSIPSLVILRDANARILRVNEAVVRVTGVARDSLKGKMIQEVLPGIGQPEGGQLKVRRATATSVASSDCGSQEPERNLNNVQLLGDRWMQTQNVPIRNSRGWTDRTIIVSTDITDFKRAELAQKQASRFQSKVGDIARIGGWDLDVVTNELSWSDMVKEIHEVPCDYQPDVATAIQFYRDDARERIQLLIDRAIADESSWDIELPLVTATGRQIYVRTMGQPVFENGRCVAVSGVFQDVTKLHQESEFRDTLFRNAPNAYFLFSEDGILECNPPAVKMLRADSKEAILQHHPADFSPELQPCGTPSSEKCLVMDGMARERGVHRFEWMHRRMDGDVFPCEVTLNHVEMDSSYAMLVAWRDLTEEQASERERDSFFALSPDLFCVIDEGGEFRRINSAWRQVKGINVDALGRASVADIAIDGHKDATRDMLRQLATSGRVTEFRNQVQWADDTDRWLEWNALVSPNDSSVFFAVARDVTERIQSEQQLTVLNDELQDANEALKQSNVDLQQFAYVASHDLQTPLRGITGFAQLLQEDYADQLDETATDYLGRITSGTERMQRLIQDLLQYSRIEIQGQQLKPIDLNQVVNDVLVLLEGEIKERNTEVECDRLPTILGEASQLFQLFTNIIANGIKYNMSDRPAVEIRLAQDDVVRENSSKRYLEMTVKDNGIGIDPEFQGQIFEVFRRLHTEREYSGTGIGLAICKRVMQRHEGEIWVTGEPGEGSCFHLRFLAYTADS
ncbi:MAG: PAS domain S-box protein, partial [Fuerstiella sp.]